MAETRNVSLHEKLTLVFGPYEKTRRYISFQKTKDPFLSKYDIIGVYLCPISPPRLVPSKTRVVSQEQKPPTVSSSDQFSVKQNFVAVKEDAFSTKNVYGKLNNQQKQKQQQQSLSVGLADAGKKLSSLKLQLSLNMAPKEAGNSGEIFDKIPPLETTTVLSDQPKSSINPTAKSIIKRLKGFTESLALLTPLKHNEDVECDVGRDKKICNLTPSLKSRFQTLNDERENFALTTDRSFVISEDSNNIVQKNLLSNPASATNSPSNADQPNRRRKPSIIRKPGKLIKLEDQAASSECCDKKNMQICIVGKENVTDTEEGSKPMDENDRSFFDVSQQQQLPQLDFVNDVPRLICRLPLLMLSKTPKKETCLQDNTNPVFSETQLQTDENFSVAEVGNTSAFAESFDMPVFDFNALDTIDFSSFFNSCLSPPQGCGEEIDESRDRHVQHLATPMVLSVESRDQLVTPTASLALHSRDQQQLTSSSPYAVMSLDQQQITPPTQLVSVKSSIERPENGIKPNISKRKLCNLGDDDEEKECQNKKRHKKSKDSVLMCAAPKHPCTISKNIFPDNETSTVNHFAHKSLEKNIFAKVVLCYKVAALYFLSVNELKNKHGSFSICQKAFSKLNLISKHIPVLLKTVTKNGKNNLRKGKVVEKLSLITDILRSLLYYRLYLSKTKFVYRNFQEIRQYHQNVVAATTNANSNNLFNDEGVDVASIVSSVEESPSAQSPTLVYCSNGSPVPDGFVAIPNKLENLYKQQIEYFRGLCLAHHHWQSVEVQTTFSDNKEFLSHLDRLCGKMSISMNPRQSCIYLLTALQWIENLFEIASE